MTLTLKNPSIQKLIDDRISTGEYASAEEVIFAALVSLEQREQARDFSTNDLNGLLDVGIQQIDRGELLDSEDVFREIDGLRAKTTRDHE